MPKHELTPQVARAWLLLLFGGFCIVAGVLGHEADQVMLGFSVLGSEPIARARPDLNKLSDDPPRLGAC